MEKELDGEVGMRHTVDTGKRRDIFDRLLALHSDVDTLTQGVEEVEERAKKLAGDDKEGSVFGSVNRIVSVHYDTMRWIARTTETLNDKLNHLEGLS